MQNESPRPAWTMLIVMLTFSAAYAVYLMYFAPAEPEEAQTTGPTPAEIAEREAARARNEPERLRRRETGTIRTDEYVAEIDSLGGGLRSFVLLGDRFRRNEEQMNLLSWLEFEHFEPLRIELSGVRIPADAVWDLEQESPRSVVLRWAGRGIEVTRRLSAGQGPYQLWQTTRVRNVSDRTLPTGYRVSTWHYVPRAEEGGGWFGGPSPALSQGLCRHDGETTRKDRSALLTRHGYQNVEFAAIENVYFVQALAPSDVPAQWCGLGSERFMVGDEEHGSMFEATLRYPRVELAPGQEQIWRTLGYFGPKSPAALEQAGHSLTEVVNLGMFAIIARGFASLLAWIAGQVGNWGLAIIILTILVRIVLYPLNERQFQATAGLEKLKPELDEINRLYPDDLEKKNAAVMEVYRRHGINPAAQLAGCLPVVFQMPVFFALYASLSTNIELYHRGFALWWTDLSAPDPFFTLPVALGGLMFLQQRMMPTSLDPAQARVMQFMPLIFAVFMLFLPAGLCLYMLTNSVLGIWQQQFFKWRRSRREAAGALATAGAAPAGASPVDVAQRVGDDAPSPAGKGRGKALASKSAPGRSRRG